MTRATCIDRWSIPNLASRVDVYDSLQAKYVKLVPEEIAFGEGSPASQPSHSDSVRIPRLMVACLPFPSTNRGLPRVLLYGLALCFAFGFASYQQSHSENRRVPKENR